MKRLNKLILLFATSLMIIAGCKKDETGDNKMDAGRPLKIIYKTNYANASSTITLYEFEYNDKKEVKTIKYYNADSVYNSLTYDASGRLIKMGTTKNPNAISLVYNGTGDVTKITESYKGPKGLNEQYRTFEYSNSQISKTNYFYSDNTQNSSVTYTSDSNGNLNSAQYGHGNVATVTYYAKENPLYNIKQNPALAFLPKGLWTNIEFILYSKNLIKEFAYTGDGTQSYTYEFDSKNRMNKVSVGSPGSTVINQTYEISYLD